MAQLTRTKADAVGASQARGRGRPPKTIDQSALVDAVETLFAGGGVDAVTIESAAAAMGVSRATMYRVVPTKEHLLGLLFERMTTELGSAARAAARADGRDARARLQALLVVHIAAAIRMRHYLYVFFDGHRLPTDTYNKWRRWRQRYERLWVSVVSDAAQAGVITTSDPVIATRLMLGMCIWVSRWYQPSSGLTAEKLAALAGELLEHGF